MRAVVSSVLIIKSASAARLVSHYHYCSRSRGATDLSFVSFVAMNESLRFGGQRERRERVEMSGLERELVEGIDDDGVCRVKGFCGCRSV